VLAHQNSDGGFAVFTKDVAQWPMKLISLFMPIENLYNDASQPDITARVVIMLNHLLQDSSLAERLHPYFRRSEIKKASERACANLDNTSEQVSGAPLPLWHGDWFRNYIYGTSFVVQAYLRAPCHKSREDIDPYLNWFLSIQNSDGGWGEGTNSYASHSFSRGPSSLEMTAFAMLPLIDYLHAQTPQRADELSQRTYAAVERGVGFLLKSTKQGTDFSDPNYLAVIFKDRWYGRYGYVSTYCMLHVLLNWQALQDEMAGRPAPQRL
jgi:squalene-hopene/tetraprenyl-beta-curcumene cyclase